MCRERDDGDAALPGLGLNQDILTGFLTGAPNFLSTLTVQSLVDIGFTVDPDFQSATIDSW